MKEKGIGINEANKAKPHPGREMIYKHQINARNHLSAPPSLPFADTVSLNQPLSLLHVSLIPTCVWHSQRAAAN